MKFTKEDWERRLAQAEDLRRQEIDCVLCLGTGGWPSHVPGALTPCKVCDGDGVARNAQTPLDGRG